VNGAKARHALFTDLFGGEEEGPVLDDRTAYRAAEIVLLVGANGFARIVEMIRALNI
jgi:hypothetical protein